MHILRLRQKKAGAASSLCACVGDDETGRRMQEHLRSAGVDVSCISVDPKAQTALDVYLLEEYGLGGKISYPGANTKLKGENIEFSFSRYPDLFVTDMSLGYNLLKCAADLTRVQSVPFVLDATGFTDKSCIAGLCGVDILIANEDAVENITRIRPSNTDNCLRACIALCDMLPLRFVVLKLGERGAYIYDGTYCDLLMSPNLQSVDVTAEHECFVGAFSAYFVEEKDVYYATKFALAASAICASRVGGFASMPTKEEILELL